MHAAASAAETLFLGNGSRGLLEKYLSRAFPGWYRIRISLRGASMRPKIMPNSSEIRGMSAKKILERFGRALIQKSHPSKGYFRSRGDQD
jgi:hypothetical protein